MPWEFENAGSMWIPTRPAASAHWLLRCSVGQTIVTFSTTPAPISSTAMRKAKVVLPAPGVATARKSCGEAAMYCSRAAACHARRLPAVPQGARRGKAGGREVAAEEDACDGPCAVGLTPRNLPGRFHQKMANSYRSYPWNHAIPCRSGRRGISRRLEWGSRLYRTVQLPAGQ